MSNNDLIVFSHLRWEFVYQRPQHLIERFAQHRKVLFVEELIKIDKKELATVIPINSNIIVIQPNMALNENFENLANIVKNYSENFNIQNPILWFYSGAFQKIISFLDSGGIVYDCMDELSAFKNASHELISEEKQLIEKSNIIFTGGKSLFEAKSKLSKNVFCFPSSVDQTHFARALLDETTIPDELKNLNSPLIGYCGVIDERIDLDLLENIAILKPNFTFVMIGPHVKIDPASLPQKKNILYLGPKSYQDLPNYFKAFDIAMMPFALNAATQYISPTKTLEYMAALKPIISTPIYDVVRDYEESVSIVSNPQQFVAAIDNILRENNLEKEKRKSLQLNILKQTSWDNTAKKMWELTEKFIKEKSLNKMDFA